MSVGAKTAVRRATLDALVAAMQTLDDVPAVFAAMPGEDFDGVNGTAWLDGTKVTYMDGGLGGGSIYQRCVVAVTLKFAAYQEGDPWHNAVEAAEDRCDELTTAFRVYLDAHKDLGGVCSHALLGEEHTQEVFPTESGAAVEQTLTVEATCLPPFNA